jgi:hypothetical protein
MAIAFPMPELEPVTSATFPFKAMGRPPINVRLQYFPALVSFPVPSLARGVLGALVRERRREQDDH